MVNPVITDGGVMLCGTRSDHDRAGAQLQLFHVLLHTGDHADDVFVWRIFPGHAIALVAAIHIIGVAAIPCGGHRQTANEWYIAARYVAAYCGVAGLYRIWILCIAGVVPATVVAINSDFVIPAKAGIQSN